METTYNQATPTTGGTGVAGQLANQIAIGSRIGDATVARLDPQGRPFVAQSFLDQFPKNGRGLPILPASTRPANWVKVFVSEVRKYNRAGQPRVSFNQGAIHVSYAQLKSAGVYNPDSLGGKHIMVDFFQRGDVLLNGSIVTDGGRIVNRFMVEPNSEVENKLEYELKKEALSTWGSLAGQQIGANVRGQGDGTQLSTNNGLQSANQIPPMQNPADTSGQTRQAAAGSVDQRMNAGELGTPGANDTNLQGSTEGSAVGQSSGQQG